MSVSKLVMRRYLLLTAFMVTVVPIAIAGQAPDGPTFDVVSIKPNPTGRGFAVATFQPGGPFIAANITARELILVAYGIEDNQLLNAPDWVSSDRFAVEARTGDDTPTDRIRLMLRTVLADRFGLVVHPERRELPIYSLLAA